MTNEGLIQLGKKASRAKYELQKLTESDKNRVLSAVAGQLVKESMRNLL